jgi:hypothetical protein
VVRIALLFEALALRRQLHTQVLFQRVALLFRARQSAAGV